MSQCIGVHCPAVICGIEKDAAGRVNGTARHALALHVHTAAAEHDHALSSVGGSRMEPRSVESVNRARPAAARCRDDSSQLPQATSPAHTAHTHNTEQKTSAFPRTGIWLCRMLRATECAVYTYAQQQHFALDRSTRAQLLQLLQRAAAGCLTPWWRRRRARRWPWSRTTR